MSRPRASPLMVFLLISIPLRCNHERTGRPGPMVSERGGKGAFTRLGLSLRSFLFFKRADFRLTMLGEQIIECLGSQVTHGGLLLNRHNFELVADLYRETDGDGNGILLARLLAGLQ